MGSTPHAHARAKAESPHHQGLCAMISVFIDTFVILNLTVFAVLTTDAMSSGKDGTALTQAAFMQSFGNFGSIFIAICLLFFAFSTIIGWNFYGEQCLRYLTGGSQRAQRLYRWCYLAALCTAPLLSVKAAWELADILNACMALPNLTALLLLWRQVVEGSRRPAGKT